MTTSKKDLRTGRSVWQSRPPPALRAARLTEDIATDILVVGAGISGAMVAEALAEAGRQVVVVDRRRAPLLGSTPASTALVQYEIDTPLIRLARMIGEADAIRAWRRSHLALAGLAARIRELGIACGMARRDSLLLSGTVLDAAELKEEGRARRAAGIETVHLDRAALRARFGIDRPAALLGFDNIALDPLRLAAGFLRAAQDRGARLHAPCEVAEIAPSRGGVRARTRIEDRDGPTIACRHLIYATGYEIPDIVPRKGHQVISTFALATRPQPGNLWPGRCFVWEASDPYLYLRTTGSGRVICGGEDAELADEDRRDAMIPRKIAAIRRKLGRLLPKLDTTPDLVWAGSFGASDTGLPSIGAVPGWRNVWAVLGYGGNGITYSRIAAELLRSAIAGGGRDPEADLYEFGR